MSMEKTDVPGYLKDTATQAVLNTNTGEYREFVAQRKRSKELRELKEEVKALRKDVQKLRELLKVDV